ncbi:unnamed protein product, partial [Heterosigma akashiwo]
MASFQAAKLPVVIVVDPISSGRVLASKLIGRGYQTVAVWTSASQKVEGIGECNVEFSANIYEIEDDFDATLAQVRNLPYEVISSMVGCESGVELNDRLSEALGLKTNGTDISEARRDKWAMQERVKECGLRGIKQTVARSYDEARAFVLEEGLTKWIMKPRRDAGSNGVFKCESLEEARMAFENITGRTTIFGEENNDVLIQEYLEGVEYIVDTVSCDGQHKVVALWEDDKRLVHGSPFVYYDSHLFETEDGEKERAFAEYAFAVADALGVRYGPCHFEIIWLAAEQAPCLVEVGTRAHGAGGNFPDICDPVVGYNQLDAQIDCYLDAAAFARLPRLPGRLKGLGVEWFFVCHEEGVLEAVDLAPLKKLRSVLGVDLHRRPGERVRRTVDLVTSPGVVRLAHADAALVRREAGALRAMERALFTVRAAA